MSDTGDWMDIQRKYWEAWSELGRKSMGLDAPPANPWAGALDHWWQAMSPAIPNDHARDFMQKLMDQGKAFFDITDSLTKGLTGSNATAEQGWGIFSKSLDELQKAFTSGQQEGEQTLRRLMAFWEMPLDNWQRTMSSLAPLPGDMLRNIPHDQVKDNMNRLLSAPGLGYTREEQGRYQELTRRWLDYQSALQEYSGFFTQLGVKSLERMRERLQRLSEQNKAVESARELYDTWIGCCEAVYAEEVSSEEYSRIHGQLVNAQMALKQCMSVMVDETLGTLNMPTRTELRTVQDRLQESRRENKQQRQELETLKRQVASLLERSEPAAAPQTPARSTAKRTTTTRKRTTTSKATEK